MNAAELLKRRIAEKKSELAELETCLDEIGADAAEPASVEMRRLVDERFDWKWIVGGLVGRGTVGMIVADPHVGKSTLAIQLCLAVAAGHNTLGWHIGEPRRVLYAFAEGARALVADRIRACAKSSGLSEIPQGGFVQAPCFQGFDVTSRDFRRLILEVRPELAVLDALGYFFLGDENSSVEWKARMMAPLRSLCAEAGTSFCVIHHQTKASPDRHGWQKGRGTSAMFGDVDWWLRMETVDGEGNEAKRILIVDKNKYAASGQKIPLVFDKAGAHFNWLVEDGKGS